MSDLELLELFINDQAQDAFGELVGRHAGWVRSTARRLVSDPGLADDVTQAVFIILARKAGSLRRETVLSSWLFAVTRYAARNALRDETRRRRREREVAAMRTEAAVTSDEIQWNQLSSALDGLVSQLRDRDRRVVLLRFYEQKSFPEIGSALAISEEAARKRVSRAVEQLRGLFARRGIATSTGVLSAVLLGNIASPASPAAVATLIAAAMPSAQALGAVSSIVKGASSSMMWASLKPAIAFALITMISGAIATAIVLQFRIPSPAVAIPTTAPASAPAVIIPTTTDGLNGRVLASTGSPLANAEVLLVETGRRIPSTTPLLPPALSPPRIVGRSATDARGDFSFAVTPANNLRVLVRAARYAPIVTIVRPNQSTLPEIRLAPSTNIRVRVLDPDGKPAVGVEIGVPPAEATRILRLNGLDTLPELAGHTVKKTDAEGICLFTDWPQNVVISFDVLDERFAKPMFRENVTLQRLAMTETQLRLQRPATLSGRVYVASDNRPVAGVRVHGGPAPPAYSTTLASSFDATTDEQGRFTLTRLPPGKFDVSVPSSAFPGHAPAPLLDLPVREGAVMNDVDFPLVGGGLVRGTVTSLQTGEPMAGVSVSLRVPPMRIAVSTATTRTSENGTFELRSAPGEREVSVSGVGTLTSGWRGQPGTIKVNVAEGATSIADFQFGPAQLNARNAPQQRGITVRGKVVDPDGKPVAQARILPDSSTYRPEPANARTDDLGRFELSNVNPRGILRARASNERTTIAPVMVKAVPEEMNLVVHQNSMAAVFVRVQDQQGQPIPGASIKVQFRLGESTVNLPQPHQRSTGPDGTWLYTGLDPDYPTTIIAAAKGFGQSELPVRVVPGRQIDAVIRLEKADSHLAGLVVDEQGNPRPGVLLFVSGIPGDSLQRIRTDEQGRFLIENLVKGTPVVLSIMESGRMLGAKQFAAGEEEVILVDQPSP